MKMLDYFGKLMDKLSNAMLEMSLNISQIDNLQLNTFEAISHQKIQEWKEKSN